MCQPGLPLSDCEVQISLGSNLWLVDTLYWLVVIEGRVSEVKVAILRCFLPF